MRDLVNSVRIFAAIVFFIEAVTFGKFALLAVREIAHKKLLSADKVLIILLWAICAYLFSAQIYILLNDIYTIPISYEAYSVAEVALVLLALALAYILDYLDCRNRVRNISIALLAWLAITAGIHYL